MALSLGHSSRVILSRQGRATTHCSSPLFENRSYLKIGRYGQNVLPGGMIPKRTSLIDVEYGALPHVHVFLVPMSAFLNIYIHFL